MIVHMYLIQLVLIFIFYFLGKMIIDVNAYRINGDEKWNQIGQYDICFQIK